MTIRQFFLPLTLGVFSLSCVWGQQYIINTYAGNRSAGYAGDSGAATSAQLDLPLGLTFDSSGNMYIADSVNQRIRKISGGTITTVAGDGTGGYSGDTAVATSAELLGPSGVAVDSIGDIFIADSANHVVREVVTGTSATNAGVAAGDIITIAGTNTGGYSGDGGLSGLAELDFPTSVAVDSNGNIYIADSGNNVIREITSSNGIINTIVGGAATVQQLNDPESVAVDAAGNLFISEQNGVRISKFSHGNLTVIAGNGYIGYSGDNGPATNASLDDPTGIAVDSKGYVYICDTNNSVIRKISPEGIITTIAGTTIGGLVTPGYYGDGGFATNALLSFPRGIVVDASGNVYVSDTDNNIIRELKPQTPAIAGGGVVNAASFTAKLSPGALATVFGSNFTGAGLDAIGSLPLQSSLGGVSVLVNSVAAPVLYESSGQINFQIPWETKAGSATVVVSAGGIAGSAVNITVQAAAPELFVQGTHAIVQNSDFSLNSPANPAKAGSTIMAYLTGAGAVSNQPADGAPAGFGSSLSTVTSTVTATLGGQTAQVSFAGLAPGFVGLWQANIVVPSGLATGNSSLIVTVSGQSSNSANVSVTP
jgi:uncharacterized protein (TIGR03437 family)